MRTTSVSVIVFLFAHMSLVANAATIHNEELSFTVQIPEGFKEFDFLKPHRNGRTRQFVKDQTLYAYNKGGNPEKNNYTGIFIQIERSSWVNLYGLDMGQIPANTTLLQETWRGHKINLFRMERKYTTGGDRMVTLNAAIPLSGEPIQFKISGDVADESEMRRILSSMLSTLDGKASIAAYAGWVRFGAIIAIVFVVGALVKRKIF
ncbi:MAG: hypothetical protein PVJ39_17500 [Gammaproteobacteria bacterium]|jgi:hypothetical protein